MVIRKVTKLEKEFICFFDTIEFFVENREIMPGILEVVSDYIKVMALVLKDYLSELGLKRDNFNHLGLLKFSSLCEEMYQNFDNREGFLEAIKIMGDLIMEQE